MLTIWFGARISLYERDLLVEPRGFEPLTSAVQRRRQGVPGVSGRFKIPLSRPNSRVLSFSLFTDVRPGNCQISVRVSRVQALDITESPSQLSR
jgi:hypothetical protein